MVYALMPSTLVTSKYESFVQFWQYWFVSHSAFR